MTLLNNRYFGHKCSNVFCVYKKKKKHHLGVNVFIGLLLAAISTVKYCSLSNAMFMNIHENNLGLANEVIACVATNAHRQTRPK